MSIDGRNKEPNAKPVPERVPTEFSPRWIAADLLAKSSAEKLTQFHRLLSEAGFVDVEARLSDDGELVEMRCSRRAGMDMESFDDLYAAILQRVNEAGFAAGLGELALWIDGDWIHGAFLTEPFVELCAKWEGEAASDAARLT